MNQASLEEWLILCLGQGKHKVNLGYFVITESTDVLKN